MKYPFKEKKNLKHTIYVYIYTYIHYIYIYIYILIAIWLKMLLSSVLFLNVNFDEDKSRKKHANWSTKHWTHSTVLICVKTCFQFHYRLLCMLQILCSYSKYNTVFSPLTWDSEIWCQLICEQNGGVNIEYGKSD